MVIKYSMLYQYQLQVGKRTYSDSFYSVRYDKNLNGNEIMMSYEKYNSLFKTNYTTVFG